MNFFLVLTRLNERNTKISSKIQLKCSPINFEQEGTFQCDSMLIRNNKQCSHLSEICSYFMYKLEYDETII